MAGTPPRPSPGGPLSPATLREHRSYRDRDVPRESVALKLEASHVESDTGSNGGLTNLQPGFRPGGSYNLVSASVDFVF